MHSIRRNTALATFGSGHPSEVKIYANGLFAFREEYQGQMGHADKKTKTEQIRLGMKSMK